MCKLEREFDEEKFVWIEVTLIFLRINLEKLLNDHNIEGSVGWTIQNLRFITLFFFLFIKINSYIKGKEKQT